LLAGCATHTASGGATLTDSEWLFTTIDGAPPVGEATLSFQGNRLAANAGCNRMAGTWRGEGGRLVAGPLAATRMFCEGRMDQERAVSELLGGSPEITLDGDHLTLKSPAHSAELQRQW
jgi:heat shock protein HslJ